MTNSSTSRTLSQLLTVTLTVVVITSLYLAKTVILPLALGLVLTFILAPLVTRMEKFRVPRLAAVLGVILATGMVLTGMGWVVCTQLIEVADDFPSYSQNIQNKIDAFRQSKTTRFTHAQQELNLLSKQIDTLKADLVNDRAVRREPPGSSPDHPLAVRQVNENPGRLDQLSGVLGILLSAVLVAVFTFFMLLNREDLRNRFIRLTGGRNLNLMTQAMDDASRRVSRYLSLQLLVNFVFGVLIAGALQLIGLPHALLWGFLAGLLRFIPYIGEPIAAVLPIALSIAVFDGWGQTLLIMALFLSMEIATGNLIEPHVYGRYTGLSSIAVLIAAIFWSLIWGPTGLILSVPLTVCLAVIGSHVPSLDFLAILLGDQPVMLPEAHYYQRLLANDQREASLVLDSISREKPLQELYDSVLIPALSLAEQDRHRNELDASTVAFITQTTRDLVEEFAMREEPETDRKPEKDGDEPLSILPDMKKVVCVPVRDDADEIIAVMLAQLLERTGHTAKTIPLGTVDEMLSAALESEPNIVCLSALPPYAISHARNIYRRLRILNPDLKIVVGLWNYTQDLPKAADEISDGELKTVCTSLNQMTLLVASALTRPFEDVESELSEDLDPVEHA